MKNRINAFVVIALATSACYVERPLQTVPPAPATRIIATVTDSGVVAMSNLIGPGAMLVEGVVSAADESKWTLQMVRVDHRDGRTVSWNREPVTFPRNTLTQPNVKILDRKRSWLAAGGIVVGALILAQSFDLLGSSEDDDTEEPPPQKPVVRVPIPFGGK